MFLSQPKSCRAGARTSRLCQGSEPSRLPDGDAVCWVGVGEVAQGPTCGGHTAVACLIDGAPDCWTGEPLTIDVVDLAPV